MPPSPFAPATALAEAVRTGAVTSRELVDASLERIARLDGALRAFVVVDADGARQAADAADRAVAAGDLLGPLHGVPVSLKDCWATAGLPTAAGKGPDHATVSGHDALVVDRLRAAGVVVLGKTTVPPGITGQETADHRGEPTANPWDLERTAGGSSGGAAAALAAGLTALDVGSDSGGSLRQPAHCCGIFAHDPTTGIVPPRGHLPSVPVEDVGGWPDLLTAGPLARSAEDLELALDVLAGPDEGDGEAWSLALPPPAVEGLAGARVAVWAEDPACPLSDEVATALRRTADDLADAGAVVEAVRPPFELAELLEVAFALWVAASSASDDDEEAARLAAAAATLVPDDPGLPALRVSAASMPHRDWLALDDERRRLRRQWADLLEHHTVLLCPVSPVVAPPHDPHPGLVADLDHRLARSIDVDGRPRPYLDQIMWSIGVGMAGLPATAVPLRRGPSGLPVGAQIVGRRFADRTTLRVAALAAEAGVLAPIEAPPVAQEAC
jgi:amidase